MYRWRLKKYKALRYPAYSKRMDVLNMKGVYQKILVKDAIIGYSKYLWYLEHGSMDGFYG